MYATTVLRLLQAEQHLIATSPTSFHEFRATGLLPQLSVALDDLSVPSGMIVSFSWITGLPCAPPTSYHQLPYRNRYAPPPSQLKSST